MRNGSSFRTPSRRQSRRSSSVLGSPLTAASVGAATRYVRSMMRRSPSTPRTPRGVIVGSRSASSQAGSYTRTTTSKRRRNNVKGESTGLQERDIGVITMYKNKKQHGKLLGTYRYQNENGWIVSAPQGIQSVDYLETILNRNQLIGITSSNRFDRLAYADDLYTLNPFYARPASALYTADSAVSRSDNLYIKTCKCYLKMLSLVQHAQTLKVYWMTPVFDTNISPIDTWVGLNDSKRLGQVVQAAATTVANVNATAGAATAVDINSNPFHHREFKRHWKALKVNNIVLQAGEQIDLKVLIDYEKIINRESLAIRNNLYLKGLTIVPMIIAYGALVGLHDESSTKVMEVAHGVTKVGTILTQRFVFGALPQSRISAARTYDGTVQLSTNTQKIIDDEDDVIVPDPA